MEVTMGLVDTAVETIHIGKPQEAIVVLPENNMRVRERIERGGARVATLESFLDGDRTCKVDVFKPRHGGSTDERPLSHTVNISDLSTPGFDSSFDRYWINWQIGDARIDIRLNGNGTLDRVTIGDEISAHYWCDGRLLDIKFGPIRKSAGRKPFPTLMTNMIERLVDKAFREMEQRGEVRQA